MRTKPHVLVSYSHDTFSHRELVLEFTQQLRTLGIDAIIDQFVEATPPQSWPRWMYQEVRDADYVLLVCTEVYRERAEGGGFPRGAGVRWEGGIITDELYERDPRAPVKFIPVLIDAEPGCIPFFVAGTSYHRVREGQEWELTSLLRQLTHQPAAIPVPIGDVPSLPPAQAGEGPFNVGSAFAPPTFIDSIERNAALLELGEAVEAAPVVAVEGLAGTGKTYLVASYVGSTTAGSGREVLWYHADHGATLDDLLAQVPGAVWDPGHSDTQRCKDLLGALRGHGRLLVVDDFQAVGETFDPLLGVAAAQEPPASVIVLSRTRVDTQRGVSTLTRVRVAGIELGETQALLGARNLALPETQIQELLAKTDGLPLAVSLFATLVLEFGWEPSELLSGTMISNERLRHWYTEAMAAVGEPARKLARFLAMSDGFFNVGVVRLAAQPYADLGADQALDELQRAYIVRPYSPFRWGIHQLIAGFIAASISGKERRMLQRTYGEYYGRGVNRRQSYDVSDIAFFARSCRYFIAAGDGARAENVVGAIAPSAKRLGQYATLRQLAEAIIAAFPLRSNWIDYHAAHAACIVGDVNAAAAVLEPLLRASSPGDPTLALSLRRLYSECLAAKGQSQAALRLITEGLDECADARETAVANAKRTAATLYQELGEIAAATEVGQELLAASARRDDRLGGAIAHAVLARSCLSSNDATASKHHANEAVRLFREVGDQRGIGWSSGLLCQALLTGERPDVQSAATLAAESVGIRSRSRECNREYLAFLEDVAPHFDDPALAAALAAEEVRLRRWVKDVTRT